jgi:hypothetical protein
MLARLTLTLALACLAPAAAADSLSIARRTPFGQVAVAIGNAHHTAARYASRYSRRPVRRPSGYYKTIQEKVWVPPRNSKVWVAAHYERWQDSCGTPRSRLVRPGYYKVVCQPGYYTYRDRRVWVPRPAYRSIVRH